GIIGTGRQARGQLRAIAEVRQLNEVRAYSPTEENRNDFAAEMGDETGVRVEAVGGSDEAVEGADIVVTATTATRPVFDGSLLDEGAHVNAVGQYDPERWEIDTTTVERAKYVPDLRARVSQDAGAFLHALDEGAIDENHVHAELGEVVAGKTVGRESDDEITLFDSGGTAIETTAGAHILYEKAKENGLGQELEFTSMRGN
ncbi:MAG: ornithine cyclodeaminase family protein, partial [Halobacteria archaeon]|nr:ornithine cyclodeaminase family protein [Halobacteria archaeon]